MRVILKPHKEKSLLRHHPWVFSGAIARVKGSPNGGDTVKVISHKGVLLGHGAYSPHSQIRVRMWSFTPDEQPDQTWLYARLEAAIKRRASLQHDPTQDGYRLVHGESDGLPGLLVDRYGPWLVCAFLAAGVEAHKQTIVSSLAELVPDISGIYERSDADVRKKEGLKPTTGVLWGEAPPPQLAIQEGACTYLVDISHGHKTGFYLDQRDNRAAVARWSAGAEVLNCFAYTGGFGVAAVAGGATHVLHIDASQDALALAQATIDLNQQAPKAHGFIVSDAFKLLRDLRQEGRQFDLIVMDPPKFIQSKAHLERGCRGYKDINLLAFQLLRPGGRLFTFSCSGLMPTALFQKIVADAALDAGCDAVILEQLHAPLDHPISLAFPEGAYLKGFHCQRW